MCYRFCANESFNEIKTTALLQMYLLIYKYETVVLKNG